MATCLGYVIDHVIALKRGGPDEPEHVQWQTKAEARAEASLSFHQ